MSALDAEWSRAKQHKLQAQLAGFWAEDAWDMKGCPTPEIKGSTKNRWIHFNCRSASLNFELKYACWQKFARQEWTTRGRTNSIHSLIRWLNALRPRQRSFMTWSLAAWEKSYRADLKKRGLQADYSHAHVNANWELRITRHNGEGVSTLREIYAVLEEAYDVRAEEEKDIWNLRRMGAPLRPWVSRHRLHFTNISQPWFRTAMKQFVRHNLPLHAPSYCDGMLLGANNFSRFLRRFFPSIGPAGIDRPLLLRYLSYLSRSSLEKGYQKGLILKVRAILELCAREGWLPITKERLLFDDEVPHMQKHLPRYIPQDVLDQLNRHLDALPSHFMRMTLIIQECGLRISELLTLRFDCLHQDARGGWYLRYYQWKMESEHTIPVSVEIAKVVQEQQSETKSKWGSSRTKYLFPNDKGEVYRHWSFSSALRRLAYRKDIRDSLGRPFHFRSHQFRHTVGTRMINLGVPQHIIQRYLGHKSPEEKLEEFWGKRIVDITGNAVEQPVTDSGGLEWLARNVLAQALPNGYCAIPLAAGPCPHPNACLTCSHFRTDITFLQVHKDELAKTDRIIEKAKAGGWGRQVEMNERKRKSLDSIIRALEKPHEKEAQHERTTAECTGAASGSIAESAGSDNRASEAGPAHQL